MKTVLGLVALSLGAVARAGVPDTDPRLVTLHECGSPAKQERVCLGSTIGNRHYLAVKWASLDHSVLYLAKFKRNEMTRLERSEEYSAWYVTRDAQGNFFENSLIVDVTKPAGQRVTAYVQINGKLYGSPFALDPVKP